jgi:hypothetical protein
VNQDRLIKDSLRRTGRLPKNFANRPTIGIGMQLFMDAFWDLTTTRQVTESGASPIPWLAIKQWCDEYDLDDGLRYEMFHFIRKLDMSYLDYRADKMSGK